MREEREREMTDLVVVETSDLETVSSVRPVAGRLLVDRATSGISRVTGQRKGKTRRLTGNVWSAAWYWEPKT